MALQLSVARMFAKFGFRWRNFECLQENGQEFVKGNVDIEEDLANTMPDADDTSTLPNEDRISRLPDDILSVIISFLNMRDAVKTSTLSRRWRYLYASLSEVNFDVQTIFCWNGDPKDIRKMEMLERNCERNKCTLAEGVNQFLKLYQGPKLHSFRVSFCYNNQFSTTTHQWIRFAVKAGVEKLDLNFVCRDYLDCESMYDYQKLQYYFFPWKLLVGEFNLKHLRLHSCRVIADLACGPNGLTTLDLNYVPLLYTEMQLVFSSCLNLEWLKLRSCRLRDKLCVSGLTRLKFLAVDKCPGLEEIELNAINLTTFEFCDGATKKLTFACVPKLEKVFFCLHFDGAFPFIFNEVSTHLPQLKSLCISTSSLWVKEIVALPYVLSIKQLELFINLDDGFDLVKIVSPLLRACPLLQKLNVAMPYPLVFNRRLMEERPQYLHTQIEEVHIGRFFGSWNHIEFASYLLKSAVMLKRIVIDSGNKVYVGCGQFVSGDRHVWSAEVRELIRDQLEGKKLSKNTEVIIR